MVNEQSVSHEVGLVPKGAVTLHAGLALLAVCGAAVDLALLRQRNKQCEVSSIPGDTTNVTQRDIFLWLRSSHVSGDA